jgi:RimJ/RimL family protein N-acetyltransferase
MSLVRDDRATPAGADQAGPQQTPATGAELVTFDETFLRLSYDWLHDPEIARLTRTKPTTRTEQQAWFDGLDARKDYWVRGIAVDGRPAGATGLRRIDGREGEFFIYLGEREFWGRGAFRAVLPGVLAEARRRALIRVVSKIGTDNPRSVQAHERLGWVRTGVEGDMVVGSWEL